MQRLKNKNWRSPHLAHCKKHCKDVPVAVKTEDNARRINDTALAGAEVALHEPVMDFSDRRWHEHAYVSAYRGGSVKGTSEYSKPVHLNTENGNIKEKLKQISYRRSSCQRVCPKSLDAYALTAMIDPRLPAVVSMLRLQGFTEIRNFKYTQTNANITFSVEHPTHVTIAVLSAITSKVDASMKRMVVPVSRWYSLFWASSIL
jgi:hypothetical protein